MKKTLLSAAAFAVVAVSAVAVAPTTSEAIPAFARQTGAACLSCHFQTFPALTAFGRAFKMGSFTDVGEQALVEDENLSIPAALNATVVIRGNYTNTKISGTGGAGSASGAWNVPSETPILIAGRVGAHSGAFVEFANGGAGPVPGAAVTVGNWQFLNSVDMGGFKVGLGLHNSTFGGSAAMEVSNVFGQHSGKLGGNGLSAINALGFNQATLGVGLWAGNEMGNLQVALVGPSAAQGTNVGFKLATMVRGALTTEVAGWDTLVGFGFVSGAAGRSATALPAGAGPIPMNMWFIDAQAQGEIGDTSIGIYADYANAKGKTDVTAGAGSPTLGNNYYGLGALVNANLPVPVANAYLLNGLNNKSTGWSLRADVKPLHNLGVGAGYASYKLNIGGVAPTDAKVTKWQVGAFYEIYQNFELNLLYNELKLSGTAFGVLTPKVKTTLVEFEALM